MKTILALVFVLAPIVLVSACGVKWFPDCKEPGNKCPPVADPNDPVPYPRFATEAGSRDAGDGG